MSSSSWSRQRSQASGSRELRRLHDDGEKDEEGVEEGEGEEVEEDHPNYSKGVQRRRATTSPALEQQEYDDYDPYNRHHQLYDVVRDELNDPSKVIYDSMSTILEVDSEDSEQSSSAQRLRSADLGRLLDSPSRNQARGSRPASPSAQQVAGRSSSAGSDSLAGRVSPVEQDRFRGTLSALAEQVERLRRAPGSGLVQPQPSTSSTSEQAEQLGAAIGEEKSPMATGARPKSRANSAESLMMITVSPMGSPRVKFPLVRPRKQQRYAKDSNSEDDDFEPDDDDDKHERRLVEVSNKSTITAIDLGLMEKMAQKYFVETSDKGSQSVKFDCEDEELDSTTLRLDSQTGKRVRSRSVAVGTEKFSRERFSLLPPTSTRSTQTRADMTHQDLGTSETRRYKLSHQQFKPTPSAAINRRETRDASTSASFEKVADELVLSSEPEIRTISTPTETDKTVTASEPDSLSKPETRVVSKQPAKQGDDSLNDSSAPESPVAATPAIATDSGSSSASGSTSGDESASGVYSPTEKPTASQVKQQNKTERRTTNKAKKQLAVPSAQRENLIPSVKTELRVIIEIQNAKQRQQSELISDSQLIDGKLSKTTQVKTSKQVAASPREVLQKLQSVGRQHSLLYQNQKPEGVASNSTTAAVAAANQSALRGASPASGWREVSRSCVRNEIEADTRRRKDVARPNVADGALVMSSDATIKHAANHKSAIELKSRAARHYERFHRDQRTGEVLRRESGERTLVESEAAFDENESVAGSKSNERVEASRKTVGIQPSPVPQPTARSNSAVKTSARQVKEERSGRASAVLETEEEHEDRRQVSRNGRLVFDDRLRERRFERSVSASPLSPGSNQRQTPPIVSPAPIGQPQRSLLKPISLSTTGTHVDHQHHSYIDGMASASPPILFADQTSNLSSDPETMDSGFAQSGAGSSSALNQAHRQHQIQRFAGSAPASPRANQPKPLGRRSPSSAPASQHLRHLQQQQQRELPGAQLDESLTFVDDDIADELVEQLGASKPRVMDAQQQELKYPKQQQSQRSGTNQRPLSQPANQLSSQQQRVSTPTVHLISPPPAFCSNDARAPKSPAARVEVSGQPTDTELTTRLTRSRRAPNSKQADQTERGKLKGTSTKLEQSLVAANNLRRPLDQGCRFRAQVMFESDTDSMSTERNSAASSRSAAGRPGGADGARGRAKLGAAQKELVSETKFTRSERDDALAAPSAADARWDYSLRVNRMRGNKVDSKVNTYIEHSRNQQRPLINLEAS